MVVTVAMIPDINQAPYFKDKLFCVQSASRLQQSYLVYNNVMDTGEY